LLRPRFNQYLSQDEIFPSRYSFTYDTVIFNNIACAFVSLDPERLGENLNDASCEDFGDNKFPHFKGTVATVKAYLKSINDNINEVEDEITLICFIPSSIEQFLLA